MTKKIKTIAQALQLYSKNAHLVNSYGEYFGNNLIALDKH